MKTFFRHLFTGLDNQTYDLGRVITAMAASVYLGIGVGFLLKAAGTSFDFQGFGIGFGSLLAGLGIHMKMKEAQEPKP